MTAVFSDLDQQFIHIGIAKNTGDAIPGNRRVREKPGRESAELGLALNSRLALAPLVVVILFR